MWVKTVGLVALNVVVMAGGAQAALVDRGGGMVYDNAHNITWLQDWNLGAGSTYDDGASPVDGRMTWESAQAWAQNLVYGGFDDWRLPSTTQPDPGCSFSNDYTWGLPKVDFLWGCRASELGGLFYDTLGGQAHASVFEATGDTEQQRDNLALLRNLQPYVYWADSLRLTGDAWSFDFQDGRQHPIGVWHELYAVAVRDGDVPEPSMAALLVLALAAAALAGQNKKYR